MEPKKHWYQKAWGKVLATISVLTVLYGIFEAVYQCVGFYNEYEALKTTVIELQNVDNSYESRISSIEEFVNRKKKSFAVGFRVVVVTDEETGKQVKRQKHRGWDLEEHTVYKDEALSEQEGYDYYFWVDKNGSRVYVW